MANNKNLSNARNLKKDEFYTQLYDIEKQVYNYGVVMGHFKDKTILLPCDESEHTNFYNHFMMCHEEYGWKKLIAVGYRTNRPAEVHIVEVTEDGMKEENKVLIGNGDFRNAETEKYFDECDVVLTNPPFSLFREFVALLMEKNKKFLIIGNQNAITYKEIFPYIKENKLGLGHSIHSGDREFQIPNDYPLNAAGYREDECGRKFIRVKGVRWYTNMKYTKIRQLYNSGIDFEYGNKMGWYQKYDNYDAINVNKTCQIPMNYDGIMGVPITFLDKYNPDQFEIIGLFNGYSEPNYEKGFICGEKMQYVNKGKILYTTGPVIDGINKYARILIKAKR